MSADNWAECPRCKDKTKPAALREDYEQGILDGKYFVTYSGVCYDCDFEFHYEYEAAVT